MSRVQMTVLKQQLYASIKNDQWAYLEEPVGHLSFGTKRQWVGEPKEGQLYI